MVSPVLRRLLPAFAVSAIGDGMSAVGVAWLAIRIAAPADRGVRVGIAVAAYTLPGRCCWPGRCAPWRPGSWSPPTRGCARRPSA
jgi:hypothetical protein